MLLLIISGIIGGLISLCGLIGAIKENFCATITFIVFLIIDTMITLIVNPSLAIMFSRILIIMLACFFARSIRSESNRLATSVIFTSTQTQTSINVPDGYDVQTYNNSPSAPQQPGYKSPPSYGEDPTKAYP